MTTGRKWLACECGEAVQVGIEAVWCQCWRCLMRISDTPETAEAAKLRLQAPRMPKKRPARGRKSTRSLFTDSGQG